MSAKKQSYTPGPWTTIAPKLAGGALGDYGDVGIEANGVAIAEAWEHCPSRGNPDGVLVDAKANARLISLAPEMADCLTELYAMVKGESPSLLREDSGGCARLDMDIRAILAKINGDA